MFKEITLQSFLSYGPDSSPIELRPLNVLLGANGTGKSNLLEAVALLSASARRGGLAEQIRKGNGIAEWIYKGSTEGRRAMKLEVVVERRGRAGAASGNHRLAPDLRHRIEIADVGSRVEVLDERIENAEPLPGKRKPFFYFGYERGIPRVHVNDSVRGLARESVRPDDSILAQRTDSDVYPTLAWLGDQYQKIRFFREWTFGPGAACRQICPTDAPADFLQASGENLALVLHNMVGLPSSKRRIDSLLQALSPGFEGLTAKVVGGAVQLFLVESGDRLISAKRLSDGTLRFLALLSVLLHPEPPPVIVLEEPELGLHPDLLPTVAKLLVEASQRAQLFVTTHSDIVVDALTDHHESVLFCEKEEGGTVLRRAPPELFEALCGKRAREPKGLGQAWLSGAFGGKRW
jgi:predicted ATPase